MNRRRILGSAFLCLAGAALALAGESRRLWIDVPFIPQTKNGCGSAAMAMILEYWHSKNPQSPSNAVDVAKIQGQLYAPEQKGIPAAAMKRYFEEAGYAAFAFTGDWNELERHIRRGRPLIVCLQPNGSHTPLHYVVVVGVDSPEGYLYVNDPAQQKMLRISREGFESEWAATHHWTLLAVPRAAN